MVSFSSSHQDASNDIHFDQFWSNLTLRSRDLRSSFDLDLLGSKHKYFDASRWEEHDGVWIMALSLSIQKLSANNSMVNLGRWRHLRGHHLTLRFKYWYCRLPPVNPSMLVFISSRYLNWKGSICLSRTGGLEWGTGPKLARIKHTFLNICISSSTDRRSFTMSVPTNVSSRKVDPDANNEKKTGMTILSSITTKQQCLSLTNS